jgi:hypothetical protein
MVGGHGGGGCPTANGGVQMDTTLRNRALRALAMIFYRIPLANRQATSLHSCDWSTATGSLSPSGAVVGWGSLGAKRVELRLS